MISGTHPLGVDLNAMYSAGERYHVVPALRAILQSGDPVGVDIETFGLGADGRRIKSVAIASTHRSVVLNPRIPEQKHLCRQFLGHVEQIVMHNSPFDFPNLYMNDLVTLECSRKVTDILVYARLAMPDVMTKKNLETLAKKFLGLSCDDNIKQAFRRLGMRLQDGYRDMDIDTPMYLMGNAMDALVTARLVPFVRQAAYVRITSGHPFTDYGVTGDEAWRLVEREQRLNRMTLRRSCKGLLVDFEYLDKYRTDNQAARTETESLLISNGVSPGNGNSLTGVLEKRGELPSNYPRTPKTRKPSATALHLERLKHPLADAFIVAKQLEKNEKDYLQKCVDLADAHGRIHPTVNILAATTGRMSMGDPPLHQFPDKSRGIILCDPGDSLVSIDWSQIEPVTMANIAGDHDALEGYESGLTDFYAPVAAAAGVTRGQAKITLLAQLFGEGIGKLAHDLDKTVEEAQSIKALVFRSLPKTRRLIYKLKDIAEQYRKIFTISGRILDIPMGRGFNGGPPTVATHKAINYTSQGGAYDLLAETGIGIIEAGLEDAVYLFMHDECVVSKESAHDVRRIMETPPERLCFVAKRTPKLRTDMTELGERWAAG